MAECTCISVGACCSVYVDAGFRPVATYMLSLKHAALHITADCFVNMLACDFCPVAVLTWRQA